MEVKLEKLFRYIVVISTVLFVVYWLLPFVNHLWLTDEQLELAKYDTWGGTMPNHPAIYWGIFTIWLVISLGLFLFLSIARTAFVVMQVATLITSFFWGFLVLPPVSAAVGSIVTILDGVILAMVFLTSIANKFKRSD